MRRESTWRLDFGVDRLKKKFNRLHDEFQVGHWCEPKFTSKGKLTKKVIEYGLKHDYDMHMLGEIFKNCNPIIKLGHALAQDPPAVDVLQRAIEEGHVSKVVHTDPDPIEVHGDLQEFDKKRKTVGSSSEYQHKEAKKSRSKKFEARATQLNRLMERQKLQKLRLKDIKHKLIVQ
ncbi:hypothetical protein TSUD_192510 [Trifolium subterraneum]|uniref:Uncharacterized protein n=1 Tax=Trifolium subterraneum TaxID=3900 RepID=A0A2Z6PGM5_TRISU|nr:hypothetical protein TSUD_192510 [Trifolium subterraneum]